ncbi:MAG: PIF1 family DEAD/DEAH box helicase [Candidatus Magasanikbacteria bacterium]
MKQEQALEIMKMGHNVFLTGEAGSGKTYLLEKYINYLEENDIKVAVTASTGIAATHLDGVTIHSWSGIGVSDDLTDSEISNLLDRNYLKQHFKNTRVLIIDEISMLTAKQLDMIDRVCKAFKKNKLPFGGLQVILSGDFFQLPPVSRKNKKDFVFKSHIWKEMDIKICYLKGQFRNKSEELQKILSQIRTGEVEKSSKKLLQSRLDTEPGSDDDITKLYTHNKDVDKINSKKLSKINKKEHKYKMSTDGKAKLIEMLQNNCLAKEELTLKKGALVMFIKNNFEKGYVNGTLGKIKDFKSITEYPIVETEEGKHITVTPKEWKIKQEGEVQAKVEQMPLKLAWALTVHKSQGMTLDKAEIDLSKCFIEGMGYVALSRVKSLDGLFLDGINKKSLKIDKQIRTVDKKLKQKSQKVVSALREKDKRKLEEIQKNFLNMSVSS